MKRTVAIAACGFSLAGCAGLGLPSFGGPPTTTIQFESEPAGAEARTSTGQSCRTPCAQAVVGTEFTVTFTLAGHQPQTVPVRISASTEPVDPNTGVQPAPRMVPNPVFVELQPAAPPAATAAAATAAGHSTSGAATTTTTATAACSSSPCASPRGSLATAATRSLAACLP